MGETVAVDVTLFTNLLGAIGLGSASGLNAWIPLLGLGIAQRVGAVTLTEPFDRLGSNAALIVLGLVFLIDLVGDKIAVVDHVLHAAGTVVAPASGAVVFAAQENLLFEKGAGKAHTAVQSGQAQAAFIINATRMEQLKAVSDAKDVMPQKSTYFQPKLITGAVLRAMA